MCSRTCVYGQFVLPGTDSLAHLRSGSRGWQSFHPIPRTQLSSLCININNRSCIVTPMCTRCFRPVSMPVDVHSDPHELPPPSPGILTSLKDSFLRFIWYTFCRVAGAKNGTTGCKWTSASAGCIADGSFFQSKGGYEVMRDDLDAFFTCANSTRSTSDLSCSAGEPCCTPYLHDTSLHKQFIHSTIVNKCISPSHSMSAMVLVFLTQ